MPTTAVKKKSSKKKPEKQDPKLIAYTQDYEVNDLLALWKIKKKDFMKLIKGYPLIHSRKVVENLLKKSGYTKHPKPKKAPIKVKLSSKFFKTIPIVKL